MSLPRPPPLAGGMEVMGAMCAEGENVSLLIPSVFPRPVVKMSVFMMSSLVQVRTSSPPDLTARMGSNVAAPERPFIKFVL